MAIGAQTERRGLAGPVRLLLGSDTSPAALLLSGGVPDCPTFLPPQKTGLSDRKNEKNVGNQLSALTP
jgi:hypothetical protein